mgnify:CR=1 FL=1
MLDDDRDRSLQHKQLISVVLVTVLVVAWSYFFLPSPPPPTNAPLEPVAQENFASAPDASDSASQEFDVLTSPEESDPSAPSAPSAPSDPPDHFEASAPVAAADMAEPVTDDAEDDEVRLRGTQLDLVFTRVGARLKRATVILGNNGADSVQLVPRWSNTPDAEAVYPLGLRFAEDFLGDELDRRRWDVTLDEEKVEAVFSITLPGTAALKKTFRLYSDAPMLDVEVEYVNLEAVPRLLGRDIGEPAFSLSWGPNVSSEDANKGIPQEIIWRKDSQNEHHPTSKLKLPPRGGYNERRSGVDWAAVKSAYFVVAIKPDFEGAIGWVAGMPLHFRLGVGVPRMELAPGEAQQRLFRVYLGPTHKASLNKAWADLDSVMQFFTMFAFMDTFAKLLLGILNWFYHNIIPNYGLAIIFLTVLVRIVVFPLTFSSMKNMKRMQKLAPEMERIKAEVGDNQQELQKRMMEMYREYGVSPLGGCFPLLLQMPVFFALYRMLWSAFELRRAPFMLWINDLSEPDRLLDLPFAIPIPFTESGIDSLNLLPILMGVAMVASMKLTPSSGPIQNPQQKMMMTFMPILFSVICYNMASGLNLYILVSTLLGIAQNYAVHFADIDVELKKKKPITRPRHFYSAAQARKREIAKEIRKEKKLKRLSPEARQKRDQDRKP